MWENLVIIMEVSELKQVVHGYYLFKSDSDDNQDQGNDVQPDAGGILPDVGILLVARANLTNIFDGELQFMYLGLGMLKSC